MSEKDTSINFRQALSDAARPRAQTSASAHVITLRKSFSSEIIFRYGGYCIAVPKKLLFLS
jgi:hypothetical protein